MAVAKIKCLAIHEASHAVIGHALGLTIHGATIKRQGDTLGMCTADRFGGSMRSAVWAAAGPTAEFLFLESVGEAQELTGSDQDWLNIEEAVAALCPSVKGAFLRGDLLKDVTVAAVLEDAANIVEKHWAMIEHVANYLIVRKTLLEMKCKFFSTVAAWQTRESLSGLQRVSAKGRCRRCEPVLPRFLTRRSDMRSAMTYSPGKASK